MEVEWYLMVADKEVGPLSARQLKAMAERGQITPGDPVRCGSDGRWVPAANVKGLLPTGESTAGGSPPRPAPESNKPETLSAPPQAQPVSQPKPGHVPVAQPAGPPSGQIPVAQPVDAAPRTPAPSARSGGGVDIDAGDDTLVSRYAGRHSGTPAHPKKRRRRNDLIVVALAVTLVGLIAVGAGLLFSRTGRGDGAEQARTQAGKADVDGEAAVKGEEEKQKVFIPGLNELLGEPAPESPEQAEPEPPAGDEWTDASTSSAECGDVRVKIAAAQIGRPRLIRRGSQRAARPKNDYLSLKLELFNKGKMKKLDYTSWNVHRTGVRLIDEHGNEYAMKSFAGQGLEIDGQVEGGKGSLYPEEVTRDVLMFEKPAKSAERLRLELSAAAFGEVGSLKFEIPVSTIAVAEEPGEDLSAGGGSGLAGPGARQGEVSPGREVPAISRAIAEMDAEGGAAEEGDQPAAAGEAAKEEATDAPIAIPGVHGEESEDDEEEGESFADNPELQKAYEELRRAQKEEEADEGRGGRKPKNR